ncbi:dihydrolipoamide dehydrogenase [Spirochaeta thermophila DSM 6578]|uniref:Dihydrolipoyl dehydrogenase n=1 Tax=Winmispira thermophila (strain ATCC 700085 / DSM 6578 / Z-1203) TaxID=869211 RepID=G0GAP8_WINT7|nr:dihydrolipoyl dehydrogenase [Spirochaeta thermophila]AEJ61013.1 dihydrolipoamide dehydrogenase [Spirochaeta thermophila DSM 6578]
MSYQYDLVVLGSGPGGYVAAIRASQLGLKAAVVEKDKLGGVCLNIGCIPSKALIHMATLYRQAQETLSRTGVKVDTSGFDYEKVFSYSRQVADRLSKGVQYLLKKNKVDVITGEGVLEDPHTVRVGDARYTGKFVLVATGSSPRSIPGFEIDELVVLSSTGALMLKELPTRIIILGGGAIGMEFAYVFSSFGVQVTVVEMLDQVLPFMDHEVVEVLVKDFSKRGITILTSSKATSLVKTESGVVLTVEGASGRQELQAEKLLVSIGRAPNTRGIGLEEIGVQLDERGFVKVGDYYQTAVEGVYAIGDILPTPQLAHVASKEGEIAVLHMAGRPKEKVLPQEEIPSAVYTEPQVAGFGLTEKEAKEKGLSYKTAVFPFRGVGKAVAVGEVDGFVKLVYDPETEEILGAFIVGPEATELVHELLLAKRSELLLDDISHMVHAHPTLSEGVMEAARMAQGWAIHV